jgi:hypothetical protein
VCVCVCAHERACVRGTCQHHNSHHVCAFVRACMCVYIHTCMYMICTYTCIQHDIYAHTHVCKFIYVHISIHTFMHCIITGARAQGTSATRCPKSNHGLLLQRSMGACPNLTSLHALERPCPRFKYRSCPRAGWDCRHSAGAKP